jgi:hypothetical protein
MSEHATPGNPSTKFGSLERLKDAVESDHGG